MAHVAPSNICVAWEYPGAMLIVPVFFMWLISAQVALEQGYIARADFNVWTNRWQLHILDHVNANVSSVLFSPDATRKALVHLWIAIGLWGINCVDALAAAWLLRTSRAPCAAVVLLGNVAGVLLGGPMFLAGIKEEIRRAEDELDQVALKPHTRAAVGMARVSREVAPTTIVD